MQKLLTKLSVAAAIITFLAIVLMIDVFITMNDILDIQDRSFINLERGSTIKSLASDLNQKGYLERPEYLILWARLQGVTTRLKAGEYTISPGDTLIDLLDKMISGKVEQYKLTFIEGWTFKEMLDELSHHPQIVNTIADLSTMRDSTDSIMQRLGYDNQHPEGRFYPDTYFIHKNTSDIDVLKRSHDAMQKILTAQWNQRDDGLPFDTPYEALILASIVEKESALAEERSRIAGVFINRLRKKMRLQTDPTVIYGMGKHYDGDIRFKDLRRDTPYNTYTRHGLPPTPIAMPGLGAINAVMHPERTDALYFVAYGDGTGRHHFSSNLRDHETAVNQYQKHH